MPRSEFWQGNKAIAMAGVDVGCRFFGGYPITPSTEIAEVMAEELPKRGGKFIQMEDELGGIAAAIGGSIGGKKAMTATSGPGFSLKQEHLGYAYIAEIPIVVVDVMRGGPSTGLPTKVSQSDVLQARWGTHGDHATIAYSPASVQECYDLTVKAFNNAERFRQPVLIMSDEVIGHMREKIVVPDAETLTIVDRKRPTCKPEDIVPYQADDDDVPPMPAFGDGYRWHVTGLTTNDWGFPTNSTPDIEKKNTRLLRKVDRFRSEVVAYEVEGAEDADTLVVSYGCVSRSALRAVREMRAKGVKVGHFRPITLWPFADVELEKLVVDRGIKHVIVPEINMGQMFLEIDRAIHGHAEVISKPLLNGELFKPAQIMSYIEEVAK